MLLLGRSNQKPLVYQNMVEMYEKASLLKYGHADSAEPQYYNIELAGFNNLSYGSGLFIALSEKLLI